jgi:hypothetical protein
VLVLGCHDLNMFSPRVRARVIKGGERWQRCERMREVVRQFRPTLVLHHPHATDTWRTWRMPWLSLAKDHPQVTDWVSGICYYRGGQPPRASLDDVLTRTTSAPQSTLDLVALRGEGAAIGRGLAISFWPI